MRCGFYALCGCSSAAVAHAAVQCEPHCPLRSSSLLATPARSVSPCSCFDEFNRLKEDQLSAISQQIQTIQAAIRERKPSIALLGQEVTVNFSAGIFVTLNPAGKGYGGRSKLPDNLKQLFRPVAMTKPDNELIAGAYSSHAAAE